MKLYTENRAENDSFMMFAVLNLSANGEPIKNRSNVVTSGAKKLGIHPKPSDMYSRGFSDFEFLAFSCSHLAKMSQIFGHRAKNLDSALPKIGEK